jgi:hypothetical protein
MKGTAFFLATIMIASSGYTQSSAAQNSNATTKDSKPSAKDKRPHPIPETWGCNFGSTGAGASSTTTNGVLISLKDGCPNPLQKTFSISTPALMIGKNAYVFGYHTDAEARIVAAVFCQRAGGQLQHAAGMSVFSVGLDPNHLQYADPSFAVQSFDPQSPQDITLKILGVIFCQR